MVDTHRDDANQARCALCRRSGVALTRHHLIPRRTHRQKRVRRRFGRATRLGRVLWLCRPCHRHIHAVLSEREMADTYNTVEMLRSQPEIERFAQWIGTKPAGFTPAIRPPR